MQTQPLVSTQHASAAPCGDIDQAINALTTDLLKDRRQVKVSKVLRDFDGLPNAAGVSDEVVAALCGCNVSTVWERSKRGALPKPRKIGGSTRWNVGELRAVLTGAAA